MDHYKDLLEGVVLTEEYFEKPPNHQILASALVKSKNPRTRNSLNIRIYGVYSLPKKWIEKIGDPNEEAYTYEVKVSGIDFKGAKIKQRELTDEEKAEAEALKGKKGAKGKGDEEPLPEEIALKQKIEQNREELMELSERERFFKIHEDPTKSISLQFDNPKQSTKLQNESLWEFEDVVNEDNGVFLQFNKIQIPEDDNDPKKKGGKGKPVENLPSFYSKGWIDFTPFITPGKKHTIQRIPLKACNPPVNEAENENNENEDGEEKEPEPIFEDSQSYIYLHVSTEFAINPSIKPGEEEEPEAEETEQPPQDAPAETVQNIEDSYIEEDEFMEDEKPKLKINPEVYNEIDSNMGYFTNTSDATANYRIIIQKYLKRISDHYSIIMAPDETEQKANAKAIAIMSHTSTAQRQKRIEKYILQSGKMYGHLKKELKMAIHRIIRDKYRKTVTHEGLNSTERAKFIAELYAYLSQQIRITLESTVNQYRGQLHEDLVEDLILSMKSDEDRKKNVFKEEYIAKMERLAGEYENIGNFRKAEQFYTKLMLKEPNNVKRLTTLGSFCLKRGDIDKGFEFLRRAKEADPKSQKLILAYAGILISRKRYVEAKKVLSEILDVDFKHCHANILYSLICEANNRAGLVRKHIAIAKVQRMRELELLPRKVREIPNLNEINFKLERPNWANIATKDQSMDSKDNDKLFFEVIEFMLSYNITSVADNLLKYIQNKESDKYKLEFARTRYQQHVYDEAVESLDKILSKTENNASALILRGNSFYDDGNIFDSEESYIKFIQNCSIKDAESRTHYYYILERLGMVYIERKSWKDAKVVFLRCTSENPTMNGWLNLGIACLKLNSFNEAEDALTQANLLDTHNAKIWGYICLLCLKYHNETRNDQAEFCLSRALKLKIEDDYLLEEIGDIYGEKHPDFSVACYERCIQITDKRGEIYHKYGSILLSLKRNQRPKAIQLLKDAVNKIEGDQNKSHIALILQEALREEGRDQEAEEYAHYIQGASTASK